MGRAHRVWWSCRLRPSAIGPILGGVTSQRDVASPSRAVLVARPVLVLVAVMWAIEVVDAVLPVALDQWGIVGRSSGGAVGVLAAPFLHAGFGHLIANTLPFLVLGMLVAWRAAGRFWVVLLVVVVVGGLGVWLLSSPTTLTVGASGVVFGFAAYLITAGVLTRHWLDILIAIGVVLVYGTMFSGVVPFGVPDGVSWLAHLTGALAGVLAAFWFAPRQRGASDRPGAAAPG